MHDIDGCMLHYNAMLLHVNVRKTASKHLLRLPIGTIMSHYTVLL